MPTPYARLTDPQTLNLYAFGTKAYNWFQETTAKAANGIQQGKKALDLFNGTIGFKGTNCASAENCMNALGMAGTAVVAAVASGGGSEEGFVEKQIATAGQKIENILTLNLTEETLEGAQREANGGMKVAKVGGGFFDHVGKVEQALSGLNRQVTHLQWVLERSGLSDSQVNAINGLLE
jgi:hypothetical protein